MKLPYLPYPNYSIIELFEMTTTPNLLSQSLATVKDTLQKFATQSDYLEQLKIAFGDKFDTNIAASNT